VSPRHPGADDQGRPIVAELGRPETPDEIVDRRAKSSAAHRANQTLINLLLAIGASLVVVVVLVLLVVRPDQGDGGPRADYIGTAKEVQPSIDATLAAPPLPDGWYANRAELDTPGSGQVESWQVGLVSPGSRYVGLTQGIDADATWIADQVGKLQPTGHVDRGGLDWTVYDHRGQADAGDVGYALVATSGDSTIVLTGSATDAEFATVATAIGRQLP
jgi:hypothetical protein